MRLSAAARAISLPVATSPVSETMPHVRVADDARADRLAVAGDHVQDARREDLRGELRQAQRRQRRLLGRLEHDDVAGRERRRDLPDGHHQRVVPGRDLADDPDRLAADHRRVAAHVLAGRAALEHARRAGEEAEVVGGDRHLVARRRHAACRRSATRAARAPRCSRRSRRRASAASRRARRASSRATRAAPPSPPRPRGRRPPGVPCGTSAIVSPVDGLMISAVSPSAASTHLPPTKFW